MRRRRTTSRAELRMTVDQVHARMREIGARGNPDDPEYGTIRQAAVRALTRDSYPRVDAEHAGRIFDIFRTNPSLIPGPPPST